MGFAVPPTNKDFLREFLDTEKILKIPEKFDIGDWNYCPNCGAKMDEMK